MTAAAGIKLSSDWRKLIDDLDPNTMKARLAKGLNIAAERTGRDFQRRARAAIRGKAYAPNSPITVILKGSSTPLVDRGDLFQGLTYQVVSPYELRLGVLRARSGTTTVNVGLILHEGATIDVRKHPQVRRKVWAMTREKLGPERMKGLKPKQKKAVRGAAAALGLSVRARPNRTKQLRYLFGSGKIPRSSGGPGGATVWIIPPRPFIADVIAGPDWKALVLKHYGSAVAAAFGGRS